MGTTAADTQRQIEALRLDLADVAGELDRRLGRALDVKGHVAVLAENPAAVGAAALTVVGVGVIAAAGFALRARRSRSRVNSPAVAVPLVAALRSELAQTTTAEPGMIKRLLWTGLVAAMMALGGIVARRASAALWRAAMQEDPPGGKA
ncbi:MAG: hypothetical protein U0821_02240 [Chloroflexota bacterium]